MIDFYFAPTPNGWKVTIMLEECALPYRPILVDLPAGDQFDPDFKAINPNAKIPAIVDHGLDGKPVAVFESGAILLYLHERTGLFGGADGTSRKERDEWLFWQAANLGPMAGQLSHFVNYAPAPIDYAIDRYRGEYERCLGVLEVWLTDRPFIHGAYSIADMMSFPWVFIAKNLGVNLARFPALQRWRAEIKARPAVRRAIDLHKGAQFTDTANADNAPRLFNQNAGHLKAGSAHA
ncbi:MAG: glutathione S-transferase N-terminal domain-containing protein [Pseudomonadota bacterium]